MSASSKKKLRKEQAAAQMTEKQLKQQKEEKKLRATSIAFVAIMLVIALIAATVLSIRGVNNSGIIDRNTQAAVVGDRELNSVQVNYYFTDYVMNMYNQWYSRYGENAPVYAMLMGLDVGLPLDEQVYDEETNQTWADYLLNEALTKAKSDYALYDLAMAENYKLTEEQQKSLDNSLSQLSLYAMYYGYKDADTYLRANYGYGSNLKSYTEYSTVAAIANSYYNNYSDSLKYDDAAIREYEKDKFDNFSSFSYHLYEVNRSDYLTGGTTGDDGKTTYSDAENEAALKAAEEVANKLAENKTVEDLDAAIKALEINAEKENAASTKCTDVMYNRISNVMQDWIASKDRVANDVTVIEKTTTSTDADGKETKTTTGYYVILWQGRNDNLRPLANVRHLLVAFEGGTPNEDGTKTYSDAEKNAAKSEAELLLKKWQDGEATEESFIELVKKNSDDSTASTGGLFEDIHAGSAYVEGFLNWAIDADRKAGDAGVVETEYGYHVMYYVGDGELTYRDYMISEELRSADLTEWYDSVVKDTTFTVGKTNRLPMDMVLVADDGHDHEGHDHEGHDHD